MKKLDEYIKENRTIAISGHTRPDGDCVGTCMGLYLYIKDNYPDRHVDVFLEPIAESYKRVQKTEEIKTSKDALPAYDLFISLDNSQLDRMTEGMCPVFERSAVTLNIDHHISNSKFAQINHIVSDASSASEVLYDLLDPEKINLSCAEALYMGIICDSGVFKYSSTSEHTMAVAGKLMTIGVSAADWIDGVFYERTYIQARLLGQALLNSERVFEDRCIYTVVTRAMFEQYHADKNDLEGIVEQLRLTKGVEVAILISESEDGKAKYSFRSKNYVDVNAVAGIYGGGGHIRAAGCSVDGDYKAYMPQFLKAIEEQLNHHV